MSRINGNEEDVRGMTISELLEQKGYEQRVVVVEINEDIVPKSTYDTHVIQSDDVVEIVSFVGGG